MRRIFQEMVANAARHGEKGSLRVRWYSEDGFWILETVNRYSPGAPDRPGGIGLQTLRERVEILGGHLVISRRKGEMNMRAIFPEAGIRAEE